MEEEDEIHQGGQLCKFPRVGNEELEHGGGGGGGGRREGLGGFNSNWHHSSRIIRVSRASGGKDRHSKVMTSKGLRDRRVRLSVTTAIQFYDLQDRLGYDQPSKAVEWLIKSASEAISELPSLNNTFPDTPKQLSDEKRAFHSVDAELLENNTNGDNNVTSYQNQNLSLSKSGCSSNSETSKGSGLSLARSDIRVNRVKARERARTRTAKEKEKEVNEQQQQPSQSHNNNNNVPHQTASFTELLTGGMNNTNSPRGSVHHHHHHNQGNNENEARQQWSSAPMDYFSPMLLGTSSRTQQQQHHQTCSTGFSLLSLPEHQAMSLSPFSSGGENHYSFIPHDQHQQHQHIMPAAAVVTSSSMNEYNLNFTISSSSSSSSPGLVGYNRGTLQSNSPSLLPHQLQRFSSIDGSSSSSSSTLPFFMGHGVAAQHAPSTNTMENNNHHHQFSSPFDSNRLHLCYGDACRHSDQKGKPKN